MNHWLDDHVPPDSLLVLGYYALNSDGFLKWIEQSGMSVPQRLKHFDDVEIWFLQRAALDGKEGYLCVSKADIAFFKDDAERKSPDQPTMLLKIKDLRNWRNSVTVSLSWRFSNLTFELPSSIKCNASPSNADS